MESFQILVIVSLFILIVFFLITWPIFNIIVETSQNLIQPVQDKIKKEITTPQEPKPSISLTEKYNNYLANQLRDQIKQAGGIVEWIEANQPNKYSTIYQPTFVEIWTTQFPYICIYSNMDSSRVNNSAQQLVERQGFDVCLGDPTCDVMTLIEELVQVSEMPNSCAHEITQKWSFPRSQPPHEERSIVFPAVLSNKQYKSAVGRDVIVRIVFNPKPSPALFRTNWQRFTN